MIERIKGWIEALKCYKRVKAKYVELIIDYENTQEILAHTHDDLESTERKLRNLMKRTREKMKLEKWEKYWTKKHPKKNITYIRHETDGDYHIDVRSFFMPDFNYPSFKYGKIDEVALRCLVFVMEKIHYVSDLKEFGYEEYWPFAYQTLKRKRGDCDGGAILLANIMLHNGIPNWRVRLNAGWVKEPYTSKKVGHAYVTYCRETDNEWVVLDWTYYPSYHNIEDRPLHKDMRKYYDIWWSTTATQSYANKKYLKGLPEEFNVSK